MKCAPGLRACALSVGDDMAAYTTDAFMGSPPRLYVVKLMINPFDQTSDKLTVLELPTRVNRVKWTDCNRTLLTAHIDGFARKWDSEVG